MTELLKRSIDPIIDEGPERKLQKLDNENGVKRKIGKTSVILMMYSGIGYFGMQKNTGFKTIEGDLLQALYDANLVDDFVLERPQIIRFQRASKTDKNVSALGQVCSMKLNDDATADLINAQLSPQIRVLDVFRTTKSFNAKGLCKHRVYRYICPTFSFSDKEVTVNSYESFRLPEAELMRFRNILQRYKGTHNFHNFTSGRKPEDPSCKRYMIDLACEEPFVSGRYEYVTIVLRGQSFMIHQIRKMVGLTMATMRGFCDQSVFELAFQLEKVDIPRAPGLGLILDNANFDSYNYKLAVVGNRKAIDWNNYKEEVSKFATEFVYSHITSSEENEQSMEQWLDTLSLHTYAVRAADKDVTDKVVKDEEADPESDG